MSSLVLVRHAETTANGTMTVDSRPPGAPLSSRGQEQASELAARLANRRIGVVIASSALRAVQTAEPLARSVGLPVQQRAELLEADMGDLEGLTGDAGVGAFLKIAERWSAGRRDLCVPGGESWNAVALRMRRGLPTPALLREHDDDVVVVGHSLSLQIAMGALLGTRSPAATGLLPNTGTITLRPIDQARWELVDHEAVELSDFTESMGT